MLPLVVCFFEIFVCFCSFLMIKMTLLAFCSGREGDGWGAYRSIFIMAGKARGFIYFFMVADIWYSFL